MVRLTGKITKTQEKTVRLEPVGKKCKIYLLEESISSVEQDSPVPGMTNETQYGLFTYIADSMPEINYKLKKIRSKRIAQGWKESAKEDLLELDFGDTIYSEYRINYNIREVEVFV